MKHSAWTIFWSVVAIAALLGGSAGISCAEANADTVSLDVFDAGAPFALSVDPASNAFVNRYLAFLQKVDPLRKRIGEIHTEFDALYRETIPLLEKETTVIAKGSPSLPLAAKAEKDLRDIYNRLLDTESRLASDRSAIEPEIDGVLREYTSRPEQLTRRKVDLSIRFALLNEQIDALRQAKELAAIQLLSVANTILQGSASENDTHAYARWSVLSKNTRSMGVLLGEVVEARKALQPDRASMAAFPRERNLEQIDAITTKKRLLEAAIPATAARIEELGRSQDPNSRNHAVILREIQTILKSDLAAADAAIATLNGDLVLGAPTFLYIPPMPNAEGETLQIRREQTRIAGALMDSADGTAVLAREVRKLDEDRAGLIAREEEVFSNLASSWGRGPEITAFTAISDATKARILTLRKDLEESFKREEQILETLQAGKHSGAGRVEDLQVSSLYAQLGLNHEHLAGKLLSLRDQYTLLDIARGSVLGFLATGPGQVLDDAGFLALNKGRMKVDSAINQLMGRWAKNNEATMPQFFELKRNGIRLLARVRGELDAALASLPTTLLEAGDTTFSPFADLLSASLRNSAESYTKFPSVDQIGPESDRNPWARAVDTGESYPFLLARAGGFAVEFQRLTRNLYSSKTSLLEKRLAVIEISRQIKLPSKLYFYEDSFTAVFGITRGGVIMRGIGDPARHRAALTPFYRHAQAREDFILNPTGVTGWLGEAYRNIPGARATQNTVQGSAARMRESGAGSIKNNTIFDGGEPGSSRAVMDDKASEAQTDGAKSRDGGSDSLNLRNAEPGLTIEGAGTSTAQPTLATIGFVENEPGEPVSLGVVGIIGDIFFGDADRSNGFDWNGMKVAKYAVPLVACGIAALTGVGAILCAPLLTGVLISAVADILSFTAYELVDYLQGEGYINNGLAGKLDLSLQFGIDLVALITSILTADFSRFPEMFSRLALVGPTAWRLYYIAMDGWGYFTKFDSFLKIVDAAWETGPTFVPTPVEQFKTAVIAESYLQCSEKKVEPYRIIAPWSIAPDSIAPAH